MRDSKVSLKWDSMVWKRLSSNATIYGKHSVMEGRSCCFDWHYLVIGQRVKEEGQCESPYFSMYAYPFFLCGREWDYGKPGKMVSILLKILIYFRLFLHKNQPVDYVNSIFAFCKQSQHKIRLMLGMVSCCMSQMKTATWELLQYPND